MFRRTMIFLWSFSLSCVMYCWWKWWRPIVSKEWDQTPPTYSFSYTSNETKI